MKDEESWTLAEEPKEGPIQALGVFRAPPCRQSLTTCFRAGAVPGPQSRARVGNGGFSVHPSSSRSPALHGPSTVSRTWCSDKAGFPLTGLRPQPQKPPTSGISSKYPLEKSLTSPYLTQKAGIFISQNLAANTTKPPDCSNHF